MIAGVNEVSYKNLAVTQANLKGTMFISYCEITNRNWLNYSDYFENEYLVNYQKNPHEQTHQLSSNPNQFLSYSNLYTNGETINTSIIKHPVGIYGEFKNENLKKSLIQNRINRRLGKNTFKELERFGPYIFYERKKQNKKS